MSYQTAFQHCTTTILKRPPGRRSIEWKRTTDCLFNSQRGKCVRTLEMNATTRPPISLSDRGRGGMRPKQSLGQNFLKDRTMINRIVDTFDENIQDICPEAHVVEVGPGLGALTERLFKTYPNMLAVEIDQRAVSTLTEFYPGLNVRHEDVLNTNWLQESKQAGKPLAVIGNLPYNIMSQILFSLFESPPGCVSFALVMMQKEVAERIVAKTRTKSYGILSVVGQLYSQSKILFSVPNTVFYPKPDITSSMVLFHFIPDDCLDVRNRKLTSGLRTVVRMAFNQRRKVLKNSLKSLCDEKEIELPENWAAKRAEELTPQQFVLLTRYIFRKDIEEFIISDDEVPSPVWRPVSP